MTDDGWIPFDYFDEYIPQPRATPTLWIGSLADGAPALAPCWDGDTATRALADGDAVTFLEYRDCGRALLTVSEDGSWSVDREMPASANLVYMSDGTGAATLAAFVDEWKLAAEWVDEPFEPGTFTVHYAWWSDELPFRFVAETRTFERVAS